MGNRITYVLDIVTQKPLGVIGINPHPLTRRQGVRRSIPTVHFMRLDIRLAFISKCSPEEIGVHSSVGHSANRRNRKRRTGNEGPPGHTMRTDMLLRRMRPSIFPSHVHHPLVRTIRGGKQIKCLIQADNVILAHIVLKKGTVGIIFHHVFPPSSTHP